MKNVTLIAKNYLLNQVLEIQRVLLVFIKANSMILPYVQMIK